MQNYKSLILLLFLSVSIVTDAQELNCPHEVNPVVCNFLHRYLHEIKTWQNPDVSLYQKLRDDKFLVLDGSIDNLSEINDSTKFMLVRFDDKGYEASWYNGSKIILDVAFPIQFELLIGLPQYKIEQFMHDFIVQAPQRERLNISVLDLDSLCPNIYTSSDNKYFEVKSLNTNKYLHKDYLGKISYIADTLQMVFSIANLLQGCLNKDYIMQVQQQVYGMKSINYTIQLNQWLNYCSAEKLTIYTAIEEELENSYIALVVAENKDLGYNHILSINIPKSFLENSKAVLQAKLTAFIPTHNVQNLYEQYTDKSKKKITW